MASSSLTMVTTFLCLCFFLFTSTFALDMSIIDYDRMHGNGSESHTRMMYEHWLVKHGKNYNALGEKERRFEIFKDNLKFVNEHNAVARTYQVGLNKFADLTNDEFRSMYLGAKMERKKALRASNGNAKSSERYAYKHGDALPESVDWRAKGAVGPVKDQGQCGKS